MKDFFPSICVYGRYGFCVIPYLTAESPYSAPIYKDYYSPLASCVPKNGKLVIPPRQRYRGPGLDILRRGKVAYGERRSSAVFVSFDAPLVYTNNRRERRVKIAHGPFFIVIGGYIGVRRVQSSGPGKGATRAMKPS